MAPLPRLASLLLVAAAATACLKVQARTPPSAPALDAPEAPTHLIIPVVIPEPEPPPVPPASPPATPPKPQSSTPTRPADRTPPPVTPPPSTTPVSEPPATPPPVLQTTSNGPEEERKVQAVLKKAGDDLGHVTYAALKSDARAHYDLAKKFIFQAENALKIKNYPFAAQLAEKAANLASQLLKSQ